MFGRRFITSVFLFLLLAILFPSLPSRSHTGVNVYDERVYEALDKLAAAGYIKDYNPNQRPLTRMEIARLLSNEESDTFNYFIDVDWILDWLKDYFKEELDAISAGKTVFRPVDHLSLAYFVTDERPCEMPDNHLGSTGGMVSPLTSYMGGRRLNAYFNFYHETSHFFESDYVAWYLAPRFFYQDGRGAFEPAGGAEVGYGYLKGSYKDIEIEVGRDEVIWGPGRHGALLLTDNARPLDMVKVSTPSPFRLPWIFKHLGDFKASMLFSWLGTKYNLPNAILSGYRIDYRPWYWMDIAFNHLLYMGGSGADDPDIGTALGEFLGFIFRAGNNRASSNHLMGFDLSIKVPAFMGTEFYVSTLMEDKNKEPELMFKHDMSYMGGVYVPFIGSEGRLGLRAEFVRTGEYAFRHSIYGSGHSLGGRFLGYDAGSDTYSFLFSGQYNFAVDELVSFDFRYLKRSSNTYRTVFRNNDLYNIEVDRPGTKEIHYIFGIGGEKRLGRRFDLLGETRLDYVKNKNFVNANSDLDFSFLLTLGARL